jgi:hypothetical protein
MPSAGRIIARRGQQVSPSDVVAEVVLRPEHLLLDIGLGLGLSPKDADHYIQRRAGDEVGEGDVIAGPVGIGRRVVRAPKSGTVVVAGGGQVLLELEGQISQLKSGYSGIVSDIIGDRGVVVESVGSLIQCVWGNGKVNFGLLNILAHNPEDIVTPEMMEVNLRGSVIVGGYCDSEKVFQSAEELPIRGMILASMDSSLVDVAKTMDYPIVLVEGFGKLSMNPEAFKILASSALREAAVIAESWDRLVNTRPEIVITLPEGSLPEIPTEVISLAVGQTVRVVSPPYKSMLGTIASLQQGLSVMPSGLRMQTAGVRLLNGDTIQVPISNLEIIG